MHSKGKKVEPSLKAGEVIVVYFDQQLGAEHRMRCLNMLSAVFFMLASLEARQGIIDEKVASTLFLTAKQVRSTCLLV